MNNFVLKLHINAFNKALNTYLQGELGDDPSRKEKGRISTISLLQNHAKMEGIDLSKNGTDVDAPNEWIPIVLNDYEMYELMRSNGASLTTKITDPNHNLFGITTMQAIIMFAADMRFFNLLPLDYDWNVPIKYGKNENVFLPLQKMIENYCGVSKRKDNKRKEQIIESIKWVISKGANINLNVEDKPSIVMTIIEKDCPAAYELLPLEVVDKNKKYIVDGKEITNYEFLQKRADEMNNVEKHEKYLK